MTLSQQLTTDAPGPDSEEHGNRREISPTHTARQSYNQPDNERDDHTRGFAFSRTFTKFVDKKGRCRYCNEPDEEEMLVCDGVHDVELVAHWHCMGLVRPPQPDQPVLHTFTLPNGALYHIMLRHHYCPTCRWHISRWRICILNVEAERKSPYNGLFAFASSTIPSTSALNTQHQPSPNLQQARPSKRTIRPLVGESKPVKTSASRSSLRTPARQPSTNGPGTQTLEPSQLPAPELTSQSQAAAVARKAPSTSSRTSRAPWTSAEEDIMAQHMLIVLRDSAPRRPIGLWRLLRDVLLKFGYGLRSEYTIRRHWVEHLRDMYRLDERYHPHRARPDLIQGPGASRTVPDPGMHSVVQVKEMLENDVRVQSYRASQEMLRKARNERINLLQRRRRRVQAEARKANNSAKSGDDTEEGESTEGEDTEEASEEDEGEKMDRDSNESVKKELKVVERQLQTMRREVAALMEAEYENEGNGNYSTTEEADS